MARHRSTGDGPVREFSSALGSVLAVLSSCGAVELRIRAVWREHR